MPRRPELSKSLASVLREEILAGKWTDRSLPSERELAKLHGTTRLTARRGLQRLCAERLLEVRPARGYVLSEGVNHLQRRNGDAPRTVLFFFVPSQGYTSFDPIEADIFHGASREASQTGIELYATSQHPDVFRRVVEERRNKDLRGVLLDWADPELARFLMAAHVPFVVVEDDLEGLPIPSVLQDNAGGVRLALTHLAEKGHRRIGLIVNYRTDRVHSQQRLAAYREFTLRAGWETDQALIAVTTPDDVTGRAAAARLLDLSAAPTALFVASQGLLDGVFDELRARGMSYPKDISLSVWGAPGRPSRPDFPPVTHVAWDRPEMGRLAMRVLEERIRLGHGERMVMKIETRLVDCGSVARLAEAFVVDESGVEEGVEHAGQPLICTA